MHYVEGEDPRNSCQNTGYVLVIDDDNLKLSQTERTQTRHQSRNYKRKKLAKRLFLIILKDHFGIDPYSWPDKDKEFLLGLFNRRGYNRFEDESLDEITLCDSSAFYGTIPELEGYEHLEDWLQTMTERPATINDTLERLGNKADFVKKLPARWSEEKESIKQTHQYICDFLRISVNASEEGHLHRRKYLKNIAEDIESEKDHRLADLFRKNNKHSITPEELACLIGHISNLQLRVLRRYSNNKEFNQSCGGDHWDDARFSEHFWRWVKSWHCDDQTKQHWHQLIKLRKSGQPVLNLLLKTPPELTIPPYEDQNNRRPPKDKALYLSASALDNTYPLWREIVKRFLRAHAEEL